MADGAGRNLTKVEALFVAEREKAVHGWAVKELGHQFAGESGERIRTDSHKVMIVTGITDSSREEG